MRGAEAALTILAITLLAPATAPAETKAERARRWHAIAEPGEGPPRAIGEYSAGCVDGARALPLDGPGYHVMRPGRQRHYGHPALIEFVRALGARVRDDGLGVVLVGDLGQPRGGPAPSGHSSHQSGLDVDIWYLNPARLAGRERLDRRTRRRLRARSVVDWPARKLTGAWSPRMGQVLARAARDERVARIFVNPVIKKHLCDAAPAAPEERAWLGKLRPWYGHADHFHVRLHCPDGSTDCVPQDPVAPGDGCEGLDWWLRDDTEKERARGQKRYQSKVGALPPLPAACAALIE